MSSEQELVLRAAKGDREAFSRLWGIHRDAVHRFSYWMLQDTAGADDITQECFLALLEHPRRFDPERGSLRTFLFAIARNQCRSRWREAESDVRLNEDEAEFRFEDPLERVFISESQAILNSAIANMPVLQREALFLVEYEDLPLTEAAAIAGIDAGTLKSRLYRGRQRLKRELQWLAKEGF